MQVVFRTPPLFGRWPLVDNPETPCQYLLHRDQWCPLAKDKSYSQIAYIICRAQCEMKMQAPCSQIIKKFKKATAEHDTKHRVLLSVDPVLPQRLLIQRLTLPTEFPASARGHHLGLHLN